MVENHVSTGFPIARKPRRYQVDEGLDVRFLCHANSAHVLQTLWRGLVSLSLCTELPRRVVFSETGLPGIRGHRTPVSGGGLFLYSSPFVITSLLGSLPGCGGDYVQHAIDVSPELPMPVALALTELD
jgi:hypothetical protein